MEHDMKISPATVRRLRIARGWSQEQLAIASGLSPRTVQRVESEGVASLSTATSLAATYGISLIQLRQEEPIVSLSQQHPPAHGALFLGIAILMLAAIGESGRLPGDPRSEGLLAVNILAAVAGAVLAVPAAVRVARARQYAGGVLAVLGVPLVTLLLGGLIVSLLTGRAPIWPLIGMGAAGTALVGMAVREFRRSGKSTEA